MANHIAEMVRSKDPKSIQKYVQDHLPSDQVSLQRIYKELVSYNHQPPHKLTNAAKSQKSLSVTHNQRQTDFNHNNVPEEAYTKRSKNLIRTLRDKGFKVMADDEQQGLKLYKTQKKRLVRPLITNSKLLKSEDALIDRLIQRYNINCNFYNNNIQDVKVNIENTVDREMREFMDRRQKVLKSLSKQTNTNLYKNSKFSWVENKLYDEAKHKVSFETLPSMKRTLQSTRKMSCNEVIMENCQQEIKSHTFRSIPTVNQFQQLQKRLGTQQSQLNMENAINFGKVGQKLLKQQYERYTHSYMKMMTAKTQTGSKCKLNVYAKELLQDEIKMRNIIDFSKK